MHYEILNKEFKNETKRKVNHVICIIPAYQVETSFMNHISEFVRICAKTVGNCVFSTCCDGEFHKLEVERSWESV